MENDKKEHHIDHGDKTFDYEEYQSRKPFFDCEQAENNTSLRLSNVMEEVSLIQTSENQPAEEKQSARKLENSPLPINKQRAKQAMPNVAVINTNSKDNETLQSSSKKNNPLMSTKDKGGKKHTRTKTGGLPLTDSKYNSQRTNNGLIETNENIQLDQMDPDEVTDFRHTPYKPASPSQSGANRGRSHTVFTQGIPMELQQHMEMLKMRQSVSPFPQA